MSALAVFVLPLIIGLILFPVETLLFVVFAFGFVLAGIWLFETVLGKTDRAQIQDEAKAAAKRKP